MLNLHKLHNGHILRFEIAPLVIYFTINTSLKTIQNRIIHWKKKFGPLKDIYPNL